MGKIRFLLVLSVVFILFAFLPFFTNASSYACKSGDAQCSDGTHYQLCNCTDQSGYPSFCPQENACGGGTSCVDGQCAVPCTGSCQLQDTVPTFVAFGTHSQLYR